MSITTWTPAEDTYHGGAPGTCGDCKGSGYNGAQYDRGSCPFCYGSGACPCGSARPHSHDAFGRVTYTDRPVYHLSNAPRGWNPRTDGPWS